MPKSKIVEVSSGKDKNWGRLMVMKFTEEEKGRKSAFHKSSTIWKEDTPSDRHIIVYDLITGEGATFDLSKDLVPQLYKHQIWVCVLYEPFLVWLQEFMKKNSFNNIPDFVELEAEKEYTGFRHGTWIETLSDDVKEFVLTNQILVGMKTPASLIAFLKKLFPDTKSVS